MQFYLTMAMVAAGDLTLQMQVTICAPANYAATPLSGLQVMQIVKRLLSHVSLNHIMVIA